jgi:putative NADPH-quinone reductase
MVGTSLWTSSGYARRAPAAIDSEQSPVRASVPAQLRARKALRRRCCDPRGRILRRETPVPSNVLVINGHPDPSPDRFCSALAAAYIAGAHAAGRQVRRIDVGELDIPFVQDAAEFAGPPPAGPLAEAQDAIAWADHVVIVHPLWLGAAPAKLKAFLEQTFRYGFAIPRPGEGPAMQGLLGGRSARVVVTMGMPAPFYRLAFDAAGTTALTRGVLWISGFRPIHRTLIGTVETSAPARAKWLARMRAWGERGV